MGLMEKYENMTEEEYEALSEEDKAKIQAEITAEAEAMAAGITQAAESMTEEQKQQMRDTMKQSQEYMERVKDYTEEEVVAEMLNPETEGYSEEDLVEARRLMAQPWWGNDDMEPPVEKPFLLKVIDFFKRLFK